MWCLTNKEGGGLICAQKANDGEQSVSIVAGRPLDMTVDSAWEYYVQGKLSAEMGQIDLAIDQYSRAIAIRPGLVAAHFGRAVVKTFHSSDPDLAALEHLACMEGLPDSSLTLVHFALAKALEDVGDYDRAFEHARSGNLLRRCQITYDERAVTKTFYSIAMLFDSALFHRLREIGNRSQVPIFVLGMPRSGSTLIEQILASHPLVQAAGEIGALSNAVRDQVVGEDAFYIGDDTVFNRVAEQYLASLPCLSEGKQRIVDKQTGNFFRVGVIHISLPQAKIIHTRRDPLDTCVSCYCNLFDEMPFSYDLVELGRYYRRYKELMDHWRAVLPEGVMLEVQYEELIEDFEPQVRRLIEFCGLPWHDDCLRFYSTCRPVKTASLAQVRKPIYSASLHRWRRYESHLTPLMRALGSQLLSVSSVEQV
jgi:tetratricopeptide (TPR) repeat protein